MRLKYFILGNSSLVVIFISNTILEMQSLLEIWNSMGNFLSVFVLVFLLTCPLLAGNGTEGGRAPGKKGRGRAETSGGGVAGTTGGRAQAT